MRLTEEEREALYLVAETLGFHLVESYGSQDLVDMTAGVTLAALTAVPRLREVEGMGGTWAVRTPDGRLIPYIDKARAVERAKDRNTIYRPGHHAVRLAVVEVATEREDANG